MINPLNIISNNTNYVHLYFFIAHMYQRAYIYLLRCISIASATATRYGLSRGLLGLKYDQINYSDSDSCSNRVKN